MMENNVKVLGEVGRPPFIPAIEALTEQAELAIAANNSAARSVLADATAALRRVVARAKVAPGFERVEIRQNRGPTIEFSGRLLCAEEFEVRGKGLRIEMEVWETAGGALVAASHSNTIGRDGREHSAAIVVPREEDEMAMRCAVMDFFDWADRARSMVNKSLGWALRIEVE